MPRSSKKGPYVQDSLAQKVAKAKEGAKREAIKTWSRRSLITPEFVGLTFAVHNGKKFISVFVTENMVQRNLLTEEVIAQLEARGVVVHVYPDIFGQGCLTQ